MDSRLHCVLIGVFTFVAGINAQSQELSPAIGTFDGKAGPLPVKLHINVAADGSYKCVADSPNQGAYGIACTDIQIDGQNVSFAISNLRVTWKGTIEAGGAKLAGTWTQGISMPLTFVRDPFVAADKSSSVDGFWLGALVTGANALLRTQIEIKSDKSGKEYCTVDSLDQRAFGMPCENVVLSGSEFAFDVPVVPAVTLAE